MCKSERLPQKLKGSPGHREISWEEMSPQWQMEQMFGKKFQMGECLGLIDTTSSDHVTGNKQKLRQSEGLSSVGDQLSEDLGSLRKMQRNPTFRETSSQPLVSDGARDASFNFLCCHPHRP